MTKKDKIDSINRLKNQLNNLKIEEGKVFINNCKAAIRSVFGRDSEEFSFFDDFEIDLVTGFSTQEFAQSHFQRRKNELLIFFEGCIETINNNIETKKSKTNILSDKNNLELFSILFGIASIVFGVGFYFGTEKINTEYVLLKIENEKIHNANNLLLESIGKLTRKNTNSHSSPK